MADSPSRTFISSPPSILHLNLSKSYVVFELPIAPSILFRSRCFFLIHFSSRPECQCWVVYQIHSHCLAKIRYIKPERPSTTNRGSRILIPCFSLSLQLKEDALKKEALTDGVFPLINNIAKDYKPKKILEIYKFQPFLEKRHSQPKTWQEITPILLKKSERVVAILHMHLMALMVTTLIERKLRLAMKQQPIAHSLFIQKVNLAPVQLSLILFAYSVVLNVTRWSKLAKPLSSRLLCPPCKNKSYNFWRCL